MAVVVVGLNHRTVPLTVLEPMTVAPESLPKALHDLSGFEYLDEVVVLSTCMRTEIYGVANRFHGAMSDIRNFLSGWSGYPPEMFSDHLYSYYDEGAVTHLFQVAAGIDSAVLGEGEILSQVRQAWQACPARAGRRARPRDAVPPSGGSRQAGPVRDRYRPGDDVAVPGRGRALAGPRLGTLAGVPVLVVGAGEMGESVPRALAGLPGHGPLLVANRSHARAEAVAAAYGGQAVPLGRSRPPPSRPSTCCSPRPVRPPCCSTRSIWRRSSRPDAGARC